MFDHQRLIAVMRVQGRRTEWLAQMTDYDADTVSRYLNGRYPISVKFARRAARALGIPVSWLTHDNLDPDELDETAEAA